ncbi:UDP-glycosyltransferase 82A1-like isoform X2 [Prosopis cineraria]|nr:UDP-glycosyltransferase 82A1-like isoform X2 [Prosopis cineraria]XP_054792915.1 UDP-glycosyltransferase 82A1-like isoform X2 [Prosopis cineraria]
MENTMPGQLEELIQELRDGGGGTVVCVVVELLASWAIQVGHKCGIVVAGFWPAMLATYRLIASIPETVRCGLISETGFPQHDFHSKMLCYPVAGDQFLNCAYIVQVWKVGMRLNGLGLKDVEEGLRMVMEDVEMEIRLRNLHDIVIGRDDHVKEDLNLKAFIENMKKGAC